MYAIVRTEQFPEDELIADPGELDPDVSVILFPDERGAQEFINTVPASPRVKFLMLHPDESFLLAENRRDEDMAPKHP